MKKLIVLCIVMFAVSQAVFSEHPDKKGIFIEQLTLGGTGAVYGSIPFNEDKFVCDGYISPSLYLHTNKTYHSISVGDIRHWENSIRFANGILIFKNTYTYIEYYKNFLRNSYAITGGLERILYSGRYLEILAFAGVGHEKTEDEKALICEFGIEVNLQKALFSRK